MNDTSSIAEHYAAPELILTEAAVERGFAETFGVDPTPGEWDE